MSTHVSIYSRPAGYLSLFLFHGNRTFLFSAAIKIFIISILTGLGNFVLPVPASAGLSISRMADSCGASIVRIDTFDGQGEPVGSGTGFFIDNRGSLVTNHHVLERCGRALIRTRDGEKGEIIGVIRDDPDLDLLLARTTFKKTRPIPFHPPAGIRINDDVICFGAPDTISMGRVTDILPVDDFRVIKISAPVLPGVSGAPVLNRDGELIAIATAYLVLDKGHFFAVPSNYLGHLKIVNLTLESLPIRRTGLGATVQGHTLIGLGLYEFKRSPLTIYFKDGRHRQCDRAWMEGDTVYLVMPGKRFAVGYPRGEIDMKKSFNR